METKKVLSLIFSIIFVCAFGFVLSWGIINFNKVKDGMSGTELYTKEDLNNAYNDGYDTALKDKDEYTELINGYRDTITTLNDNISQLNSQINILTNNNKDYKNQVSNLESQKSNLQSQVNNLTTIKESNENTIYSLNAQITTLKNEVSELKRSNKISEEIIEQKKLRIESLQTTVSQLQETNEADKETIAQLNSQITTLQYEIDGLENDNDNKDTTIEQKNSQITSLQTTVSQLQRTNELNNDTITSLNNQIASLNSQISDMTMQIQNNSSNVTALNNKIAELEKSVSYYEQYIASLENGEQVVATFEFNGSVYNIQIVNKNDTVSVVNPTSTNYVIFNYWTVNGEQIDLSTYKITTNTKIVANVTYKYDVKFMVDNETYNSQIVVKNDYATLPTTPTKDGYEFDGWTTNGVDIISDINTTAVTQNVTYVAKFTKLHTVTFIADGDVINSQQVRNGSYATLLTNPTKDGYDFVCWTTNEIDILNLSTKAIYDETIFIAKFIQKAYYFDSDYLTQLSSINTKITEENISSMSFVFETNKIEKFGTLNSGIDVYYSIDSNLQYEIDFVCSGRIFAPTDCLSLFFDFNQLTSLNFLNFDTSNVTNMRKMFIYCSSLTSLNLSNFDTSNVTDMSYMFMGCNGLTSLYLPSFDTSNVTTMLGMFGDCFVLASLDLSNFNTSNVTCCIEMFINCTSLTTLDLSSFDTRKVTKFDNMFKNCSSIETIIVGENYTLDNLPV